MKLILILSITTYLCALAASASPAGWAQFKTKYNKVYQSGEEETKAMEAYRETVERLGSLSNELKESSFKMGINSLADMSYEDFVRRNTLKSTRKTKTKSRRSNLPKWLIDETGWVPDSVDWSIKPNRVAPVKNQGRCGSCWSFATTGLLEGQEYLNSTGNAVALSEQQFLDCDTVDLACNGGNMENAIDFAIKSGGVEREKDYPYVSGKGGSFKCKFDDTKAFVTTRHLKNYSRLPSGDEEALKRAVARYGPVAVGMDASRYGFQLYVDGVYFDPTCSSKSLDHAVLVVGYGIDEKYGDYWLIKNSWGEGWGMSGYFKIARNRDNHCGIATDAVIVH